MPSLIVTSGVLAGQVFSFSDMAVVCRGQFCEVRLNDPTVSRWQAIPWADVWRLKSSAVHRIVLPVLL